MNIENSYQDKPDLSDSAPCKTKNEITNNNQNNVFKKLAKIAISPLVSLKKIVEHRAYGIADYWDSLPKRGTATDPDQDSIAETGATTTLHHPSEQQLPSIDT